MSENVSGTGADEVRDEVRLDIDADKLDAWEDVRGDYATDPESEPARPALNESEADAADVSVRGQDGGGDDRVLVEGERHDDLDMAPDGTSADEDE